MPTLAYVGVDCLGPPSPELGSGRPLSANATSLTSLTRQREGTLVCFREGGASSLCFQLDSRIASLLLQADESRTTRCWAWCALLTARTHAQPFLCMILSLTVRRPLRTHLACVRRQLFLVTLVCGHAHFQWW